MNFETKLGIKPQNTAFIKTFNFIDYVTAWNCAKR